MGIQKTNLNEEKIKELLKENYDIEVLNVEEINRGTANIFKLESLEEKYLLKEFNEKRTLESIEKEIDIINFLKNKGISVPKYISTIKQEFYIKNEDRIIILQEYVDGYTMKNNTGDYDKVIESAEILGKVTKALLDYPEMSEENIIEKNFSKENTINKIQKMKELILNLKDDNKYRERFKEELEFKIKVSNEIVDSFNFDVIRKLTIINAHGDFSVQQLIYNDEKETTVIDFETAKKMPIIWEVMRSYSYVDKEAVNGELNIDTLVEYVKSFSKYIKLNKYDLKYAADLYLIQLAASPFGYKEYNNDYTQLGLLNFAFFRTNLCKYLYKNKDIISKRLLEEIE